MKTFGQMRKMDGEEATLTTGDVLALLIAFFQVLGPFIAASLAAFSFAAWFLLRFWVN